MFYDGERCLGGGVIERTDALTAADGFSFTGRAVFAIYERKTGRKRGGRLKFVKFGAEICEDYCYFDSNMLQYHRIGIA